MKCVCEHLKWFKKESAPQIENKSRD
uniref:Uncharacterized protein n=1 Tax=Rhizophora mucronata TaxID=61149 RepID=A0A2P2KW55_RHIMU